MGDPAQAHGLALEGLREEGEDPVLRYLAGVALLELDDPSGALEHLEQAVRLDPADPDCRVALARALFRLARFGDALRHAARALETHPELPEAHEVMALLLEREGKYAEADRHLARAARLDPESYPLPRRLPREAFEAQVKAAAARLPERFRRHLDEVVVTVEDLPSEDILTQEQPPLDPELLGLFVGVALPERSVFSAGGELPPRILLFQRNLERYATEPEALREEIAVTLYHELGHYLGLDEAELEAIDLG